MASSPDTTTSSTHASHHTLPFDVEIIIVNDLIELYKSTGYRLAPLAAVSETWQRIVEKHTFQDLRLSEHDLLVFGRYTHSGRARLVKSITLKVIRIIPLRLQASDWTFIRSILPSVLSSTTAIESIRIEKWWNNFGTCTSPAFPVWYKLPTSVKQFSYYHGVSRGYQNNLSATSPVPLLNIPQSADHLEHIAVSYAFNAHEFFYYCQGVEFKRLKTLALTYRFNGIPNIELLKNASEAAKRMPMLEMLEIWEFGLPGPPAHIFRYEKLSETRGRISWQSCGNHSIPDCVYRAWKNKSTDGKVRELEVVEGRFARHDVTTFSDLVPHLMLKEKILHESTMKQVLELAK